MALDLVLHVLITPLSLTSHLNLPRLQPISSLSFWGLDCPINTLAQQSVTNAGQCMTYSQVPISCSFKQRHGNYFIQNFRILSLSTTLPPYPCGILFTPSLPMQTSPDLVAVKMSSGCQISLY